MRFQTGAVKQGRNTDSQVARIGGTRSGSGAAAAPGRFDAIAVVESSRTDSARVSTATAAGRGSIVRGMSDPIIKRIESFRCRRGPLSAERRNRGYTLYRAGSGAPVARLPGRAGRSHRGILLVALAGKMGQCRSVRAYRAVAR